jgi:hypothetical protein
MARVLVPTGMLGGGFPAETIARGIALGADVIAVDGGSTDSGPHYLGAATAKTTAAAVGRDLRILLRAASESGIPLIVGSCGTSGTDAGVDWVAGIVGDLLAEEQLTLRVARIYSEQKPAALVDALAAGRIRQLPPAGLLEPQVLQSCEHIVALMGHEPIAAALEAGADVVLAGRATDTAVLAAVPLMKGTPPGPTWHASKIAECGGLCTTSPASGGVLVTLDQEGFTIEPLATTAACTPTSVAAHMLYENADPFLMREPSGILDASDATYTALDERRVRVEGARFTPQPHTIKLEGAAVTGYETVSVVGIRDPDVLDHIDTWLARLEETIHTRARDVLGIGPDDFAVEVRAYGHSAVLGSLEPDTGPPREVGVMLLVRAGSQETATAVAKIANPLLLHLSLPHMTHAPSFAFATSPAEIERGAAYEFVLNHSLAVDTPGQGFRIELEATTGA